MTLMKILHYWDGEQWIPLQPLGQIGRSGLADGSVTTSKLADDAVTAAKIAADAVGSSEIAANAVGASELADNAVDTGALAAGAVTEAKQTLADNTTNDVTSTKHGYAPKSLADATKFLNSAATPVYAQVKDSDLSTSDITTNDVTTSKHGFVPKAPNDTGKFLRGDGTWAAVGGVTTVIATDVFWDAKGDLAAGTGADAAAVVTVGTDGSGLVADSSASAGIAWQPGASVLLYDFTITGSDQRTIDTFVDDGGHGASASLPGGYRILEVFLYGRSDQAVTVVTLDWFFNNDTGTNYNGSRIRNANTTLSGINAVARAGFFTSLPGANDAANVFGTNEFRVPGYATTGAYRSGQGAGSLVDNTAANVVLDQYGFLWKNTANAIDRVMVRENNAAQKLKVGTRLMIYAR